MVSVRGKEQQEEEEDISSLHVYVIMPPQFPVQ